MGFKRKFQIGDKVRVKDPKNSFYKKIGIIKGYSNKYDSYTYQYISDKKVYCVDFEEYSTEFYPYQLEKVEEFNNTDTKSNKLSISDLKPGMKVRIKPNLKEGKSSYVFITKSMVNFSNTIHTIKDIINPQIILTDSRYGWDIDCFSEIIRELEEETTTSEEIKFPLKEGQIVTLLDGEKYQVVKNNKDQYACYFCSLYDINKGHKCSICHINNTKACTDIIPSNHYFKWYQDQKIEDNSSKSLTISDFKIGMKIKVKKDFDKIVPTSTLDLFHFYHIPIIMKSFEEKELIVENIGNCFIKAKNFQWYPEWLEIIEEPQIFCENESALTKVSEETGIITKVTFILNEFKSEKLEHSKFTIL